TETGLKNYENISEAFGCDILNLSINRRANKIMSKKALIELGSPMWYLDATIYAYPYKMAMKLGLNLLVYGENVNYTYGGAQKEEIPSALKQFENDVVKKIDFERWLGDGITMKELDIAKFPKYEEMKKAKLNSIYLSYYVPWDTHCNYEVARKHGFHHLGHEWVREGTIEQYNSIDSAGYLVSQWLKYPKFGHTSATEMASRWIRAGMITREQAIPLVKKYDKHLDQRVLDDYLNFIDMTHKEFWEIADKWYNTDLFYKDRWGIWREKFDITETTTKKLENIGEITAP
ncbi:MAG: N-acetyl sugar amidotransferase, partial [Thermoplasmatales archaeon]|nr:N-acetyl sugar amidotransferase [Thermoplasmatales archaeon]